MHDDGPSTRRVGQLDSPDKGEKPCGVVWNPMVRPASEMELFDFTDFVIAPLCKDRKKRALESVHREPLNTLMGTKLE